MTLRSQGSPSNELPSRNVRVSSLSLEGRECQNLYEYLSALDTLEFEGEHDVEFDRGVKQAGEDALD